MDPGISPTAGVGTSTAARMPLTTAVQLPTIKVAVDI